MKSSSVTGYLIIVLSVASVARLIESGRRLGSRGGERRARTIPRCCAGSASSPSRASSRPTDRLVIASWNQWLERHTGRPAADVVGRPLLEVYPDLAERGLDEHYREALAGRSYLVSRLLHGYLLAMKPRIGAPLLATMPQRARIAPLTVERSRDRDHHRDRRRQRTGGDRARAAQADRGAEGGARAGRGRPAGQGRLPRHALARDPRSPSTRCWAGRGCWAIPGSIPT